MKFPIKIMKKIVISSVDRPVSRGLFSFRQAAGGRRQAASHSELAFLPPSSLLPSGRDQTLLVPILLAVHLVSLHASSRSGKMAEPPDIYELFCHYNSLYFDDALGACIVSWTPGMTSTLANCHFAEAGLCEICLSVPLLQSRSSADLKNVLLHAMIHAFLLITGSNNNHSSEHGPDFWAIANLINSNCRDDNKRPSGGYRIAAKHLFDEVDLNSGHQWMCVSCGNLIRNGLSREPSPSDCLEKSGHDSDCGNFLCGWHRHKKLCHGKYEKVEYYSGFEVEGKSLDDAEEIDKENPTSLSSSARKARDRLQQGEEIKDKRIIKRPRTVVEFFRSVRGDSTFHGDCSNGKQSTITGVKPSYFSIDPTIPKQPRTPWKKSNLINIEKKCHKREREITLVMKIFGVYTDEESGEEDTEPLTNKRSESRKKMRMSKKLEELDGQTTVLTPLEVISLD